MFTVTMKKKDIQWLRLLLGFINKQAHPCIFVYLLNTKGLGSVSSPFIRVCFYNEVILMVFLLASEIGHFLWASYLSILHHLPPQRF